MLVDAEFSAMPRFCPLVAIAVDVAAVDDQIVRDAGQRVLRRRSVAELDDVAVGPGVRRARGTAAANGARPARSLNAGTPRSPP